MGLLLALITVNMEAQVAITGKIVDSKGVLIPNVSVFAHGIAPTISASDGLFTILCPDDSTSIVTHFSCLGYKTKSIKLYQGETDIQILLVDSTLYLDEVTVRAAKYSKFSNYQAHTIKMNSFEVYTNPQALGDIFGSVQIIPGVQRNDNDGRLIVQGGGTDETQIYVDGLMLFNPYTLEQKNVSVRSKFSPDLFNGVALQSSGFGAQYGNAMSGILQLNTLSKEELNDKVDINVSSVAVESSVIHQTKKAAFRGNISYMDLTPYGKIVKDNYRWNKYFNQFSSDFFMTNYFNSGAEIKSHVFYNKSGVDYSYYNVDKQNVRNHLFENNGMASVVADVPLSTRTSFYAGANFAYNDFSGTDVSFISDSVRDIRINSHQKIAFQYRVNSITNSVGIENIFSKLKESYTLDSLYRLNFENNQIAVYDELSLLLNKVNVNFGLRGEYSTYLDKFAFSPRLYIAYKVSSKNILSLSMGRYFQLPNEKYLKFTNNVGYNDANSATFSYGYVHKLSKLQLDVFYKKYNHLSTFDTKGLYYVGIANGGKGDTKGINVFWKNNYKNLEYWLSYGYLDADVIVDNYPKKREPSYISNHVFNSTLKYWIKPIRTMFGSSFFIDSGAMVYKENDNRIATKTPPRNRLDISLSYVPTSSLIVHLSCQNVLGRNNIFGYEYSSDGSVVREISNPATRFYYIGVFLTLSKIKINQIKSL
jgi:hypothetical protein